MSLVSKVIPAGCILLLLAGCVGVVPAPQPPRTTPPQTTLPTPPESVPSEEPPPLETLPQAEEAPGKKISPRALASLELSSQAQSLIEENRLDEAIRILERAVNLHPGSGENYYYLAEAWRRKGNSSQASEYNNLAADEKYAELLNVLKKKIKRKKKWCFNINANSCRTISSVYNIYLIRNVNLSKFLSAIPVPLATALKGSSAT